MNRLAAIAAHVPVVMIYFLALALLIFCYGCKGAPPTPAATERVRAAIADASSDGVITPEEAAAITAAVAAAFPPGAALPAWVTTALEIGGAVGLSFLGINWHRNRTRTDALDALTARGRLRPPDPERIDHGKA